MRIKNLKQALVSRQYAQMDRDRCVELKTALAKVPVKLTETQFKVLMTEWPEANESLQIKHWRNCVDVKLEELEKYLPELQSWIDTEQKRIGKGTRSCLPKKKQRELGYLPSVENQRAIQGRP